MKSKKLVCITLLFFLVGMLNLSPVIAATPPVPVNLAQISTEELDQSDEIKTVCGIGTNDPSYQGTPIYQNCSRSSPIVGTIPVGWNFHPAKSETADTADTADLGGWFPIVAISKEGVVTKISGCLPTDGLPLFSALNCGNEVCGIGTDDPSYQGTPIYQNCSRSSPIIGTLPAGWNFHPVKSETAGGYGWFTGDGWFPIAAISKEGVVTKISGCFPTDDVPPMGCTSPQSSGNVRPKGRP